MDKIGNLKKYERNLAKRELSEGTKELYLRQARDLLVFLEGKSVTKKRMIAYKDYLYSKGLKVTTMNTYIIAVNSYLRFAGCEDSRLKTKRIQKRRSLDHVLSIEEYQMLLSYAKESGRSKYYYIMKTLAQTGIRVSELKFFTVEALEVRAIIINNKGKVREIYLPDNLVLELKTYCDAEGRKSGVIFKGNTQNPISRVAIYKMLVHLADILGHSSLEITRIYTATTAEEKRKKMDGLGL